MTQLKTISESAERLRVKNSCIRKWILTGQIGIVKVGRLVRIPEEEVERIIAAGSRPAVNTPGRKGQ